MSKAGRQEQHHELRRAANCRDYVGRALVLFFTLVFLVPTRHGVQHPNRRVVDSIRAKRMTSGKGWPWLPKRPWEIGPDEESMWQEGWLALEYSYSPKPSRVGRFWASDFKRETTAYNVGHTHKLHLLEGTVELGNPSKSGCSLVWSYCRSIA